MGAVRYVSDELGAQPATLAAKGIHDPATMPFSQPWTDVPSRELERNSLQYYWRNRAETTVERWSACVRFTQNTFRRTGV